VLAAKMTKIAIKILQGIVRLDKMV